MCLCICCQLSLRLHVLFNIGTYVDQIIWENVKSRLKHMYNKKLYKSNV